MKYLLTLFALFIGGFVAIQGSINSQLGTFLKHPIQAAIVNFSVGLFCLIMMQVILRPELPKMSTLTQIPFYLFLAGMLGALFVSSMIYLIPKIGVTTVLGATVVGQMIIGSIIDHYGFFGLTVHSISPGRIVGIVFLLSGLFLIQRF